jgi:hypothetical protein
MLAPYAKYEISSFRPTGKASAAQRIVYAGKDPGLGYQLAPFAPQHGHRLPHQHAVGVAQSHKQSRLRWQHVMSARFRIALS